MPSSSSCPCGFLTMIHFYSNYLTFITCLLLIGCHAAIITVQPGPLLTVNSIIATALPYDTVVLEPGVYDSCLASSFLINKAIVIEAAGAVIDCSGIGIAMVTEYGCDGAVMSGLTIRNSQFGLKHRTSGKLTLVNVTMIGNANAASTIHVYGMDAQLHIQDSLITTNDESDIAGKGIDIDGGSSIDVLRTVISKRSYGVAATSSVAHFNNVELRECSGAIYLSNATISLDNSLIFDNNAATGAGIYALSSTSATTTITITNTTFSNNTATFNGGSISVVGSGSTIRISDSNLVNNTAKGSGGVLYAARADDVSIISTRMEQNAAKSGSAIYLYDTSYANVMNGYFGDNYAFDSGCVSIVGNVITANMDGVEFVKNIADINAASLLYSPVRPGSVMNVRGSDFRENKARAGAALWSNAGARMSITLERVSITDNDCGDFGSVVVMTTAPVSVSMSGCDVINNVAGAGPGLYIDAINSALSISSCTFSDNIVKSMYGVVTHYGSSLDIFNTTLSNNYGYAISGEIALLVSRSCILSRNSRDAIYLEGDVIFNASSTNIRGNHEYGVHADLVQMDLDHNTYICGNRLGQWERLDLEHSGSGHICGTITNIALENIEDYSAPIPDGTLVAIHGFDMTVDDDDYVARVILGDVVIEIQETIPFTFTLPRRDLEYSGPFVTVSAHGRRSESFYTYRFDAREAPLDTYLITAVVIAVTGLSAITATAVGVLAIFKKKRAPMVRRLTLQDLAMVEVWSNPAPVQPVETPVVVMETVVKKHDDDDADITQDDDHLITPTLRPRTE